MTRKTDRQKAGRVLVFLFGVRHPRVWAALLERGFSAEEYDEGWRRLRALADARYAGVVVEEPREDVVGALDAWENTWFPVIDASLRHRFPDEHARLLASLSQTSGIGVVLSVGALLERLEALSRAQRGRSRQAYDLLQKRGLTSQVIARAQSLLDRLTKLAPMRKQAKRPVAAFSEERALQDLWAWYLEWSRLARLVVTDRRLLRALGFLERTGAQNRDASE